MAALLDALQTLLVDRGETADPRSVMEQLWLASLLRASVPTPEPAAAAPATSAGDATAPPQPEVPARPDTPEPPPPSLSPSEPEHDDDPEGGIDDADTQPRASSSPSRPRAPDGALEVGVPSADGDVRGWRSTPIELGLPAAPVLSAMQQAGIARLRLQREDAARRELDVRATIDASCRAMRPFLVTKPTVAASSQIVLLVDGAPSMLPWRARTEQLEKLVATAVGFGAQVVLRMSLAGAPTFSDARGRPIALRHAIREGMDTQILIWSDGLSAGFGLLSDAFAQLPEQTRFVWLHPWPRRAWSRTPEGRLRTLRRGARAIDPSYVPLLVASPDRDGWSAIGAHARGQRPSTASLLVLPRPGKLRAPNLPTTREAWIAHLGRIEAQLDPSTVRLIGVLAAFPAPRFDFDLAVELAGALDLAPTSKAPGASREFLVVEAITSGMLRAAAGSEHTWLEFRDPDARQRAQLFLDRLDFERVLGLAEQWRRQGRLVPILTRDEAGTEGGRSFGLTIAQASPTLPPPAQDAEVELVPVLSPIDLTEPSWRAPVDLVAGSLGLSVVEIRAPRPKKKADAPEVDDKPRAPMPVVALRVKRGDHHLAHVRVRAGVLSARLRSRAYFGEVSPIGGRAIDANGWQLAEWRCETGAELAKFADQLRLEWMPDDEHRAWLDGRRAAAEHDATLARELGRDLLFAGGVDVSKDIGDFDNFYGLPDWFSPASNRPGSEVRRALLAESMAWLGRAAFAGDALAAIERVLFGILHVEARGETVLLPNQPQRYPRGALERVGPFLPRVTDRDLLDWSRQPSAVGDVRVVRGVARALATDALHGPRFVRIRALFDAARTGNEDARWRWANEALEAVVAAGPLPAEVGPKERLDAITENLAFEVRDWPGWRESGKVSKDRAEQWSRLILEGAWQASSASADAPRRTGWSSLLRQLGDLSAPDSGSSLGALHAWTSFVERLNVSTREKPDQAQIDRLARSLAAVECHMDARRAVEWFDGIANGSIACPAAKRTGIVLAWANRRIEGLGVEADPTRGMTMLEALVSDPPDETVDDHARARISCALRRVFLRDGQWARPPIEDAVEALRPDWFDKLEHADIAPVLKRTLHRDLQERALRALAKRDQVALTELMLAEHAGFRFREVDRWTRYRAGAGGSAISGLGHRLEYARQLLADVLVEMFPEEAADLRPNSPVDARSGASSAGSPPNLTAEDTESDATAPLKGRWRKGNPPPQVDPGPANPPNNPGPLAPAPNAMQLKTLPKTLQPILRKLEKDLLERSRIPSVEAGLRVAWEAEKKEGETGQGFDPWRRARVTQLAVAWVLSVVFVRTLEDRGLIDPRIAGPDAARLASAKDRETTFDQLTPNLGPRGYLFAIFRELSHLPGAREVFDARHNPVWVLAPSSDGARDLLDFFRAVDATTGAPALTFGGHDTRFLGDLYQHLSEAVRKRYALLQTPDFVEKFILEQTLHPAIQEFGLAEVKVIDPTCGSGHFLLGAYRELLDAWQRAEPTKTIEEHARRALEQVYGVDINPYAVAIARFRLVLEVLRTVGIARLDKAPYLRPRVVVADSLLHTGGGQQRLTQQISMEEWASWGDELFRLAEPAAVAEVLGQRYHAVVGNPPYITEKDATKRNKYRDLYESASGKYALAAPFTERFFGLAVAGGFVGIINSNAWTKRDYGRILIERVFPRLELQKIIDTSGCYVPGHGTPTLLLFGRNRSPSTERVTAVLGKRGEREVPTDPSRAPVWSDILEHHDNAGFEGRHVSVEVIARESLRVHPWVLQGGGARKLLDLVTAGAALTLGEAVDSVGFMAITGADEAFVRPLGAWTRAGVDTAHLRARVAGTDPAFRAHPAPTGGDPLARG